MVTTTNYKQFRALYSYRDDEGKDQTTYEMFEAEDMQAAQSIARYIGGNKGMTLHAIGEIIEPLDKPEKSGIMTSERVKKDEPETVSETMAASHTGTPGTEGTELSEEVPAEGIPGVEKERETPRDLPGESREGEALRREPDTEWGVREAGMAPGGPPRDTGVGERLTPGIIDTSIPKDIILDSTSDIGTELGAAARFDANLDAIRTIKLLDADERQATPEEQATLAKFTGFGDSAFNDAFDRYEEGIWRQRGDRLRELTTEEEYEAIERSRLNAFFTTPEVINTMWRALRNMGLDDIANPHILEPSAGSGRFLGFQPTDLASRSQRTAVELDQLTGRMLKQMYPETEVYIMGYQDAPIPKESADIAISNVPFGDFPVHDKDFKKDRRKLTRQIHNYFFAKTLDQLRPGGLLAFVTTHGTLDSPKAQPVREALAEQADLVGAIRLPRTAFPDTDVVTDIVFMRKRLPSDTPGDNSWVETGEIEREVKSDWRDYTATFNVNKYFLDNPDMVLGRQTAGGTMYRGASYTVEPGDAPLSQGLDRAIGRMPANIIKDVPRSQAPRSIPLPTGESVYEGSRVVGEDGSIYVKRLGELVKANLTAGERSRVRAMLNIRDKARAALNTQLRDGTDEEVEATQSSLNAAYDEFVIGNGPLNSTRNTELMGGDPDGPFLRALETWNPIIAKKMQKVSVIAPENVDELKMPLFAERTVKGMAKKHTVASDSDALIVSLNELGRLDFDRMGELLGKDADTVRDELAEQRLIFKNPLGDWESADEYLSGDVREKLRTAEAAATARPAYNVNIEALNNVQPPDLTPSQIGVRLGSPWIPSEDINEFTKQLLDAYRWRGRNNYYQYVPETGEWVKGDRVEASEAKMYSEWGTGRMGANEIIHRLLNGKLIQVNDKGPDDKPVRNPAETVAAQEKAKVIQDAFKNWIWDDPDRSARLAKYYNDTFNTYRPRRFDGQHQELPGMVQAWAKKIHPHQKDAIWRTVQDKNVLLAHEVGFGKTAVMVGAGMELRRLGLSRKNVFVVPKSTHGQFEEQFRDLYPYANILVPADEDFTPSRRPEFISRAVTGDWDAIILADTQFRRIPIKPETEVAFLKREVDDFRAALEAEDEASRDQWGRRTSKKSASHKEIQKALIRLEERLAEKQAKVGEVAERTMHFEDMGVDRLFVDEADNYKNLRFATKMGRLKGLPNTDSDRAWDMYQKSRYLQDEGKGGVIFATGTPVANTIAEMYTMMRYLQNPMLEAKGLQHFDSWAKTFGETTESLEQTPTGAYKLTQRFAKFQNAPELSNIWQQTSDIRVAEESPHVVRLRPRLVDEDGKERRTVVSTPPDQQLIDYMATLAQRADELGGKDPREDNMLKIASDARMASLDMRMVDPGARQNPDGKVAVASRKIAEIYNETEAEKGAQLVFLDLGTPKAREKVRDETVTDTSEDYSETEEEVRVLRNVYRVLKEHLVSSGVPVGDIAFIHDAKSKSQRKVLQDKVNAGDIRVIVGSTGKMGVGVNVQERAAALHHLDAPWRPRDIEQREGRIVRQGNEIYGPVINEYGEITDLGPGVKIYTYVTERSFDAYMWQAIEAKSKAIKAIMRRDNPPRDIEDIDSFTMSAGEAKAVASGNPDVLKAVTLKNDVTRLQMLRASNTDAKIRANEQLRSIPKQIEQHRADIKHMEQDTKLAEVEADFAINIKGKDYTERTPAGEALKGIIEATPETVTPEKTPNIGRYKGFDIRVVNQGPGAGYKMVISNPTTGFEYVTTSILASELTAAGALQRIENKVAAIPSTLEQARLELQRSENNLATYKAQAEAPFEYEGRLDKMEAELSRLERKLQGQEVGEAIEYEELNGEPIDGEPPEYKFAPREPEPVSAKVTKAEEKAYDKAEDEAIEDIETAPVTPEPAPPEVGEEPIIPTEQYEREILAMRTPEQQAAIDKELEIRRRKREEEANIKQVEELEKEARERTAKAEGERAVAELERKAREKAKEEREKPPYPGMKLLTKDLEAKLPKLYATEDIPAPEKDIIVKYFHPMSSYTWYATEYDPKERMFFGLVDSGIDKEWGYFSLDELAGVKVRGLGVERDLYFKPQKVKDVPGLIEVEREAEVPQEVLAKEAIPEKIPTVIEMAKEEIAITKEPIATGVLDEKIKPHRGNIRAWYKEPANWENKERLTNREVAEQIIKDRDLIFKKADIPIDDTKPLGKTKTIYYVEYDGKKLREFPKEVYDYHESLKEIPAIPESEPKIKVEPPTAKEVKMVTKLEVKREPAKRRPSKLATLRNIHERRSEESQSSDERQRHSNIIEPTDTDAVEKWKADPGTADIIGIDTPKRVKKRERKVYKPLKSKSERVKRAERPKPRRPVKGKRYTKAELREIHAGRTPRSIASDNRQLHSRIIEQDSPGIPGWITDPGRADITGVDTPPITKRSPRLTGGKGPRITPQRPRLKR